MDNLILEKKEKKKKLKFEKIFEIPKNKIKKIKIKEKKINKTYCE